MVFTRQKAKAGANPDLIHELIQEKIYKKYALPFRQSSHGNIINYSFNECFNNHPPLPEIIETLVE